MILRFAFDRCGPYQWWAALQVADGRLRSGRIVRTKVRGRWVYSAQLVLDGNPLARYQAAQVGDLDGDASGQAGAHALDPDDGQLDPDVHVLVGGWSVPDRAFEVPQHQRFGHTVAQRVGGGRGKP
jgi:hypothetical protein